MRFLEIIIPVFNEAENLAPLLKRLDQAMRSRKILYQAIFIDDRSTDGTHTELTRLQKYYPLSIHLKKGRQGKAYSILEGVSYCHGDIIAMLDGDLQYPPEKIPAMLDEMSSSVGVVIARRKTRQTSLFRTVFSHLNHWLFNVVLHQLPYDIQSGLKIFRKELITHLTADNLDPWALDLPLLLIAKNLGLEIKQVDIDFSERRNGQSKLNFLKASYQISKTSLKHRFTPSQVYRLASNHPSGMLNAGVAHKGKKFITHTHLQTHYSAVRTLTGWQKIFLLDLFLALVFFLVLSPIPTLTVIIAFLSAVYFIDTLFNFYLIRKSLHFPPEIKSSAYQLAKLTDRLPVYTILCPLYREARVLPEFVKNIQSLDWPKDKLDVMLLLEEHDKETIQAARRMYLPKYFRIVMVPESQPKTKPKACNYGLIFAKGEYTVIYDAEDRPEPDQLKKAYLGFQKSPDHVACLQAKLNYYNPSQNLLTRLFTAEYSLWFDITLPGLQSLNTALPLGGTSNHFKTQALRQLRGWDAFNVTEDCDLGARLFKLGYQTAMIDSTTYEEANSRLGNWFRQRSRWIKGYIQTYFVHNRNPIQFIRQHGIHALYFQLIVGGKIAFMLINPILWALTISYFAAYQIVGPTIETLYPPAVFYLAGFSAVFGNYLFFYYYLLGLAKRRQWEHIKYAVFIPVYWLFISLAAVKAFVQLIHKPHYWEKTLHGLHLPSLVASRQSSSKSFVKKNWITRLLLAPRSLGEVGDHWITKFIPSIMLSGSLLVIANGLVSVINFFYNAFLSRYLSLEDFGLVSVITGLSSLVGIPVTALGRTVIFRSAYIRGRFNTLASDFWRYIRSQVWIISLVITAGWLISVPTLGTIFQSNPWPYLLFTPIVLFGLASSVDGGFLNGSFKFNTLAILMLMEALFKFGLSALFIGLNRPDWVYAALPLSFTFSFFSTWYFASRLSAGSVKVKPEISRYFPRRFFVTGMLVRISYIASLGLDIVLAKIFLSPVDAGRFAVVSVIGKIIYFLGSQVSQFIIPAVSQTEGEGGDKSHATFYQLMGWTTVVTVIAWIIFGLFGYLTAPYIVGDKSSLIVDQLVWYGLAMIAFTAGNSIISFHHLRRQYIFPIVGIILAGLQTLGFYLFHQDLGVFVRVIAVSSLIYLVVLLTLHILYDRLKNIYYQIRSTVESKPASAESLNILIFNWRDTKHIWGGGAEVYLQELAKRWVDDGHKVTLFCGNDHKNKPEEFIDGVHVIRRGGFFTVYIWAFLYYLFKFKGHYDLVIDSENGVPFFTPLYVREPKLLLIHHVHQNVFRSHLRSPFREIALFLESRLMPMVYRNQKVVTVSKSSQKDIQKLGLGQVAGIEIISPGVDLSQFHVGDKTAQPSFLYLGRIRPYKNLDIAIKAFAQVYRLYPQAVFNIAGWGENLVQLKKLVSSLKLDRAVKFHERVSEAEKKKLLRQSWIMLQPSNFEGWGITVMEAAASGTPTIASNVIGLRDSVMDQQTGILVPPKNPSAMADAMILLLKSPQLLKKLSQNSLTWAYEFDCDKQANNFLKAIKANLRPVFIRPVSKIGLKFAYETQR